MFSIINAVGDQGKQPVIWGTKMALLEFSLRVWMWRQPKCPAKEKYSGLGSFSVHELAHQLASIQ